jgi:hypothetical protein
MSNALIFFRPESSTEGNIGKIYSTLAKKVRSKAILAFASRHENVIFTRSGYSQNNQGTLRQAEPHGATQCRRLTSAGRIDNYGPTALA